MAAVYLAEQRSLARRVAVKVLAAEFCHDAGYIDRFQHEARAAASLVHSGIVQVHEVGSAEIDGVERYFLAQEYVAGGTLGRIVQREGPLAPKRVLEILWQVGAALAAAAERGLVHRDIKPENLMVDRSGTIKVADFGLARLLEANSPRMTQAGVAMGTPLYMSPEQIEGLDVDARSDLYSLGITAYQLLTGDPPFTGETPLAVAVKHLNTDPEPVRKQRPDCPGSLAKVIDRLIAKSPEDRYESPTKLIEALRDVAYGAEEEGWQLETLTLGSMELGTVHLSSLPRSEEDQAAVNRLSAAMRSEGARSKRRGKQAVLAAVGGVVLGCVLGITTATRPVLSTREMPIQQFDTAEEQLFHAKNADTPDAWQAVLEYHPKADAFFQNLAQRGLALCLLARGDARGAVTALERIPETAESGGEPDFVVAAARVVAYDLIGEKDRARTAGAVLLSATDRDRARVERLLPELSVACERALQRLN